MATTLRPVGHEDRLTLVGHLEELRTRLIICIAALAVTFGVCYWQNDRVLRDPQQAAGRPRSRTTAPSARGDPLEQQARFAQLQKKAYAAQAAFLESLSAADLSLTPGQVKLRARGRRGACAPRPPACRRDVASNPITLGVTEPFTQTIAVSFYAALLLALPLILYQVYAFLIPAFTPDERKIAVPLMLMVPFLFLAGLAFGYFVVLQRAIAFLQNFNDDNFDILVQASTYYKFVILFLGAIGLLFQIPVAVLAVTRTGIVLAAPAAQGPRLRDPRDRDRGRRGDADAGPDHHDAGDGPAHRSVRAEYPARAVARPSPSPRVTLGPR